jgi:hypothetical protein
MRVNLKTINLNRATLTTAIVSMSSIASIALTGCVTDPQGNLVMAPNVAATISAVMTPAPQPEAEVYEPMPYDANVAVVADRDVVFVGGTTYIWVTGPDGIRHRQFYAHGDHRADVFHRRDELHNVMARHDGRLPDHAMRSAPMGGPAHMAGQPQQHGGPGAPGAPVVAHAMGPQSAAMASHGPNMTSPHPAAPSRPAEKEKKKS